VKTSGKIEIEKGPWR